MAHGVDPELDAWGNLDFNGDSVHSGQEMLAVAFQRDFAKTFEWLQAQPPSRERDRWLSHGVWSDDFEQKIRAFDSLSPEAQAANADYMVQSAYNRFGGNKNVDKVESWVKELPPGDTRVAAIRKMVERQVDQAPERMDGILNEWPTGSDREAAIGGLVDYLAWKEPSQAIELARQLADPRVRANAYGQIASSWSYSDRPAVRRWIADEPAFSDNQKRTLLRMYGD